MYKLSQLKSPKSKQSKRIAKSIIKDLLVKSGRSPDSMNTSQVCSILENTYGLHIRKSPSHKPSRVEIARVILGRGVIGHNPDRSALTPEGDEVRNFYRSWEWKKARYQAFQIHGRRCACCGATPDDGRTRIVVDHIQPLRKRWDLRLDQTNLQVLRNDCNMGKGTDDETDYRPKSS